MKSKFAIRILAIFLFPTLLAAQTTTATLVGRILDASRAPVPGAEITVRALDTNAVRTAISHSDGEYVVSGLRPAAYEVTVRKSGFRSVIVQSLVLTVNQAARLDAVLQVGTQTRTVQVKASVPLLNTENASRGAIITNQEIEQIPLNGRDFNDLAFTVPGVQPSEERAKGSAYVTNGSRADGSNVFIDGINDESTRDAGAQVSPPLDAIQEFKMKTSNYSAEYGRLGGGVVNMALKSGGNQLHGSLFEYLRNDKFDAVGYPRPLPPFPSRNELRRNQFGATLAGPVVIPRIYNGRNHTFFMFSWEGYRDVEGQSQLSQVPTALEQQGNFSQDTSKLKDPYTSGPCASSTGTFSKSIIPANCQSLAAQKLIALYPSPNISSGGFNYEASARTPDDWNHYAVKLDHYLRTRDTLSFAALDDLETSTNPFSGDALGLFGATTRTNGSLYDISETHTFGPSLINQFHMGLTRTTDHEVSLDAGKNWALAYGIPGTTTLPSLEDFPTFKLTGKTGIEGLGDSSHNPINFTLNDWNWNDAISWVHGKHSFTFGFDALRTQYYQSTNSNFNGSFTFNGKVTGNTIADFLVGDLSSSSITSGTTTNYIYTTDLGLFAQDDFAVRPNLTLNLGLRYEIPFAPYEKNGAMSNYLPSANKLILASSVPGLSSLLASTGLTGYVGLASAYGLPQGLVYTDYKGLAPRVGLAWRPFGGNRTVVRAGYGIFYSGFRLSSIRTDLMGGFPYSLPETFNGSTKKPSELTLADPFPAALASISGVTSAAGWQVRPPNAYLQSWNFTFEQALGWNMAVEAGYIGSEGVHLGRKYDLNQELTQTGAQLPDGSFPRPYPGFGDIQFYYFGTNSSYNAGIFSLTKRFSNGLFFRASDTYGKSLDDNSGLNYAGGGGFQGAQNSLDLNSEYGRSDFDIRNVFSMSFVYQLPFGGHSLLGGWQLAGTGTTYTGQPFTPQLSGSNLIDLGEASRPNRLATGTLPNPTPAEWFNVADFPTPACTFCFGNSGRNILDGPGNVTLNLAFDKTFVISENYRLQFRWEAFNATNHLNYDLPVDSANKSTAGEISSAKPAREMQFALRFQF